MKKRRNRVSAVLAAVAVCSGVTAACLLRPMNTLGISIRNDHLVLQVQDDEQDMEYGAYMLFKNGEDPEALTYSQFYSSFAEVNVNGSVKNYSDGKRVKAPYTDKNGVVVMVQDFDGVEITQRLSFSTGNSDRLDMLRIQYSAENKTEDNAVVSVRAIIDPTISDSESDPIQIKDTSYTKETAFTGDAIPETWCIKNSEGAITAYGITSDGTSKPDTFDVADWEDLYNDSFGYSASSGISDNAVAVTWNSKMLKSGESFTCGTKYGLYSEKKSSGSDKTTATSSPKTGDTAGYTFAAIGVCSMTAAILTRKRRDNDE